jgi:hypothetical protein
VGLWKQLILSVATITVLGALGGGAEAGGTLGWVGFGGGGGRLPPYYVGRPYYGPSYGYPYYGYYGGGFEGCFMRTRPVAYSRHGIAIMKRVRVCY